MLINLKQNVPYDDNEILDLIRDPKNSELGFRMLIRKYQERMYHHIRSIVKTHEDADDVLQNTFIKIFKNIHRFEGKSGLFTWIYRIATNECLNLLEKNKQHFPPQGDNVKELYQKVDQDRYIDEEKLVSSVDTAIDQLPAKQKIVFQLRYYEEMPYEQISEITQTTVGALKASYHHAVKKIESYITGKYS